MYSRVGKIAKEEWKVKAIVLIFSVLIKIIRLKIWSAFYEGQAFLFAIVLPVTF